jgi:hypothetical protein
MSGKALPMFRQGYLLSHYHKHMNKLLAPIISFLLANTSFGQHVIEGYVIAEDSSAVPFSSVYVEAEQDGSYTNSVGYFQLQTDSLPVTLTISNVGYQTKKITVKKSGQIRVTVQKRTIELNEVVVSDSRKPSYVGAPKKRKGITTLHVYDPFDQWGIVVSNANNELFQNPGVLSFAIKVAPSSYFGTIDGVAPNGKRQLRLRMYKLGSRHLIGEDILHEVFYLSPRKKGWYSVDITSSNVKIPSEGFIMAVEWIEDNPSFTYEVRHKRGKKTYETQYGIGIHAHKMSSGEQEFYRSIKLIHLFSNKWQKDQVFPDFIPCFRLEFIEM